MIAYSSVVKVKKCGHPGVFRESRHIHAERPASTLGIARGCGMAR